MSWIASPGCELDQIGRALADRLDDQHDRSGCRVGLGDRERDAFRAGPEPDDDELAGPADLRDAWRLHDEARDIGRELLAGDDRMHEAMVAGDARRPTDTRARSGRAKRHSRG